MEVMEIMQAEEGPLTRLADVEAKMSQIKTIEMIVFGLQSGIWKLSPQQVVKVNVRQS
jgi:hypothetical protein